MKTTILLTLGLMIFISCFSKSNNDLTFVPRGSFSIQDNENPKTVSIDNFWMSNEITNKEFRQFFNQIKNSPNDSITWLDFSNMKNSKIKSPIIVKEAYSDIIDKLMIETAWKSIVENGDYFTNPKYDDYPVVGVTYDGARFYCLWRTELENKELKKQNKVLQMDYRLPTQYEWEYALTFNESKSITGLKELHETNKGDKNKLGLINLKSNVSEWTCTSGLEGNDYKIVKGNSWKFDSNNDNKQTVKSDIGTDYIGFRIVRSDLKK